MPTVAFVRAPIAPLHAEPRVSSPQLSQALFGHMVLPIGAVDEWHRVRTLHDGYEGWTHNGYLAPVEVPSLPDDPDVFGPYAERRFAPRPAAEAPEALRTAFGGEVPLLSLGCLAQAGDRRLQLPLGALLYEAQSIVAGEAVALDVRVARFAHDGPAVADSAFRFEGTAYQWGGLTPWGADCSGFVQAVYGLHGVELPRDAWQQALVGADAGRDLLALDAGDLLFFSDQADGRVTHVGLSLGEGRMAHLGLGRGGWAVESLDDRADPYVDRLHANFVGARRVI